MGEAERELRESKRTLSAREHKEFIQNKIGAYMKQILDPTWPPIVERSMLHCKKLGALLLLNLKVE